MRFSVEVLKFELQLELELDLFLELEVEPEVEPQPERVLDLASPDQTVIEYRHMPDMNAVRTSLLPLMDQLREAKTIKRKADARQ